MAGLLAAIRSGADALSRLACSERWAEEAAKEFAAEVASVGGIDDSLARQELCSRALADPRLPALSPRLAAEAIVRLLGTLAPVRGVSIWMPDGTHGSVQVCGEGVEPATVRSAANAVLSGTPWDAGGLVAVPVRLWRRPAAALVLAGRSAELHQTLDQVADAAAVLALVLERDALLDRNHKRERELVEAGERRLARLAFDIHDGPLQTVSALGLELGLLASEDPAKPVDRIRELHERVAMLETELRELTHTLEPTSIARRPLAATLARQALTNARDHGGATEVRVTVAADRDGVTARVTDNGCGFDVASALPAAARKGRLGLVGMSERMRLLGGHLDVESRTGGPTTITASLPHWSPLKPSAGEPVPVHPIAVSA
jgi:signal transduction histidine kinase